MRLTLSSYTGSEEGLKNIYARPVMLENKEILSVTYRYATKDITKNYILADALHTLEEYSRSFHNATIFTTEYTVYASHIDKKNATMKKVAIAHKNTPSKEHDTRKKRLIPEDAAFLYELGITNAEHRVKADAYNKYKQIDKFIETVDALYMSSSLSQQEHLKIVDFGCGKGYLTFALYYYFHTICQKGVEIEGIERRKELVEDSNKVADKCGYTTLRFIADTIENRQTDTADIIVALHACDTATDDAIAKGVSTNATMIILAPCCQKYVRHAMKVPALYKDILKHGILAHREADIITDGLRAMTLEYFGYKTQVSEFISPEYTSKNILLTAVKQSDSHKPEMLRRISVIKDAFGLQDFYLDRIAKLPFGEG